MPSNRESISLDFGIEETVDQGRAELLEALSSDPKLSSNPEDVQEIETDEENDQFVNQQKAKPKPVKREKVVKSPVDNQKPKLSEDEEEVDETVNLSEMLQNSLLGLEEEESTEDQDLLEGAFNEGQSKDTVKKGSSEKEEEDSEEEEPIWTSLSKDLNKLGIFSSEEDDQGNEIETVANTPEEFKEKFVSEIRKGARNAIDNFLSKFGEDRKQAFEAIYVKGVDPQEYFKAEQQITNFKDLDLTIESNQEQVVRKALKDQDFEDEDIAKEIARLKNYGDLESVSQRFHKSVVKKEEAKLLQMAAQKEQEIARQKQLDEEYENNVYSILTEKYKAKDFDGIPVNKQFAEKTMDYLTTKKFKLPSGELLTEFDKEMLELKKPTNHSLRVKYAMLLQLMKTDPTLSTIKKRAVSEDSNAVFQEVTRNKSKKLITGVQKAKAKSFFD